MSDNLGTTLASGLKETADDQSVAKLIELLSKLTTKQAKVSDIDAAAKLVSPVVSIASTTVGGNVNLGDVAAGDLIKVTVGNIVFNITNTGQPLTTGSPVLPVKPRVYLSHQAEAGPALETLNAIRAALTDAGFEVLLDAQRAAAPAPVAGDQADAERQRRRVLYTEMGRSHAGVIIVSEAALQSDWVQTEATVLTRRRNLKQFEGFDYTLITVFIPPATAADLTAEPFAPLQFEDVPSLVAVDAPSAAAAVIANLQSLKSKPPQETLYETMLSQIIILLKRASVERPQALEKAAAQVGAQDLSENTNVACIQLARAIWESDLETVNKAVLELATGLPQHEDIRNLIGMIAPSWVDASAACWVPEVAMRAGRRVLALNGTLADFTAPMYVRRAYFRTPAQPLDIVAITGKVSEHALEELTQQICAAIKKALGYDVLNDAQLIVFLKRRGPDEPLFVVIPPDAPIDQTILDALLMTFPTVTFFLLTGENLLSLPNLLILRPSLAQDEEMDAYLSYQTMASRYK